MHYIFLISLVLFSFFDILLLIKLVTYLLLYFINIYIIFFNNLLRKKKKINVSIKYINPIFICSNNSIKMLLY